MRFSWPRCTIRRLMVVVVLIALFLGLWRSIEEAIRRSLPGPNGALRGVDRVHPNPDAAERPGGRSGY